MVLPPENSNVVVLIEPVSGDGGKKSSNKTPALRQGGLWSTVMEWTCDMNAPIVWLHLQISFIVPIKQVYTF